MRRRLAGGGVYRLFTLLLQWAFSICTTDNSQQGLWGGTDRFGQVPIDVGIIISITDLPNVRGQLLQAVYLRSHDVPDAADSILEGITGLSMLDDDWI